ncbi:MAG: hypothetical protein ABFE13_02930 [Phycisphaerales bacterium]
MDRDVDGLLRRNAERQLAGFDWDRQRRTVMQHLAATQDRKPRRGIGIRIASGVAAGLVLAAGYLGMSLLGGTGRDAMEPIETTTVRESVEDDPLLASTDPATILMAGSMRLLVSNDPMLAPHSLWDQ